MVGLPQLLPAQERSWLQHPVTFMLHCGNHQWRTGISISNGSIRKNCSWTLPVGSCEKVIHKKSVGRAENSNFLIFPLCPLIFYVLLSRKILRGASKNNFSLYSHNSTGQLDCSLPLLLIHVLRQFSLLNFRPVEFTCAIRSRHDCNTLWSLHIHAVYSFQNSPSPVWSQLTGRIYVQSALGIIATHTALVTHSCCGLYT